ncbi:DNA methyltransferase [Streptomyces sp. UP1A-1]|nr:DNA methyltransferase [Streptomyces sp. UP1A-1]
MRRRACAGRRSTRRARSSTASPSRDRETSASYYTPESLTKVTVELALKHRLDQEKDEAGNVIKTRASELLKYRICEPALGSGAFLNEAINQVAEEYLRRRQDELGRSIPTAQALTEKQKVKAYIALHNAYGVDLNRTGVELAEVSLWLNTMHPGMRAPWFGLHLRRGNSLIGGRRAVYAAGDVSPHKGKPAWLKDKDTQAPTRLPFRDNEAGGQWQPLPDGAVHQFLLPTPGWAAVTRAGGDAKKLLGQLAGDGVEQLKDWKKGVLQKPERKYTKAGTPRADSKTKGEAASQYTRLRDAARRAEFLWKLVVKRMELSEREITRSIDVWEANPTDDEFAFLRRAEGVVRRGCRRRRSTRTSSTPWTRRTGG